MKFIPKKKWKRWTLGILGSLLLAGMGVLLLASPAVGNAPSGEEMKGFAQAPNHDGKRFVNGLPSGWPSMWESTKEWTKSSKHGSPVSPPPVERRRKADYATAPESGLRITWLGHSTSLVELDGAKLLIDPVWSRRISPLSWVGPTRFHEAPLPLGELPAIDAVLISHDHYDHLDKATVVQLAAKGLHFVTPLGVGSRLKSWGIRETQIEELDWWDETQVQGLRITATPARHFSGRSLVMADRGQTLWAGFAIRGATQRVFYSGDSGMFPGFAEIGRRLGPFDAALLEVGAYHRLWADLHMGPEQAASAARDLQARLLIPVHWGTFNLAMHGWTEPAERLIPAAQALGQALAIPKPGQLIEPERPPELQRWWPKLPWESAAQHPVLSSGMPE